MTATENRPEPRIGVAITVGAVVLAAAVTWYVVARNNLPSATPQAATGIDQSGEPTVVIPVAALARAGIVSTPLASSAFRHELSAYGSVIDILALGGARTAVTAAHAAAVRAEAVSEVARQELERTQALYADNRNASIKALQSAQAAVQGTTAEAAGARAAEQAQTAAVLEEWGPVVGRWAIDGTPELDRLFSRRQVLLLVSLPAGSLVVRPPIHAAVRSTGSAVQATYISAATRTDPRVQGAGFFYVARASATLLPGTNITAALPTGKRTAAVLVPRSAVIWMAGAAWVYVQTSPTTFVRRLIATDEPTPNGYAVTSLPPGTRVVTRGAQLMLSQEFRPPAQAVTKDLDG